MAERALWPSETCSAYLHLDRRCANLSHDGGITPEDGRDARQGTCAIDAVHSTHAGAESVIGWRPTLPRPPPVSNATLGHYRLLQRLVILAAGVLRQEAIIA